MSEPETPPAIPEQPQALAACLARIDALKSELDGHRPLSSEQAASLKAVYDLQQTFHSNAIEGNTLSYEETRMVLEHGVTISGKPLRDHLEAINHRDAIAFIESLAGKSPADIAEDDILKVHQLILHGIDTPWAGRYRAFPVYVTRKDGSLVTFADQAAVPGLVQGALAALRRDAQAGMSPVQLAAGLHFRLVNIHPFKDANGRTARLMMNLVLIQHGYPPAVIRVEERERYIEAIEAARAGNLTAFELFVCSAVEKSLVHTLTVVRNGGLVK